MYDGHQVEERIEGLTMGIEGLISIPRSEDGQFICISGEDFYCGVC